MANPLFSICTIFRDEERFLPEFLDVFGSVTDDFVLVDTGSRDKSLEILKARGFEWHSFEWIHDFSAARNFSLAQAKGDWIFVLDVDDRVTPEVIWQLRKHLETTSADALSFRYASTMTLEWKGNARSIKAIQPRMMVFRNHLGIEYRNSIHETPIPSLEENNRVMESTSFMVYHLGYARELHSQKNERNKQMILQAFAAGDRSERTLLHYVMAQWKGEESEYELLNSAWENSGEGLRLRIAETAYAWLLDHTLPIDFEKEEILQKLGVWEQRILQKSPHSLILEFRAAREAFLKNLPNESLKSYRKIYDKIASESTLLRYRSEVLYRLGFLFAVVGDFGGALSYLLEHEHEFGPSARVFHQKIKIFAVRGKIKDLEESFLRLPADLNQLAVEKKAEVEQIVKGFQIIGKEDILRRLK
jgi:glycosyltransferase involved in cell wall biosynthesis